VRRAPSPEGPARPSEPASDRRHPVDARPPAPPRRCGGRLRLANPPSSGRTAARSTMRRSGSPPRLAVTGAALETRGCVHQLRGFAQGHLVDWLDWDTGPSSGTSSVLSSVIGLLSGGLRRREAGRAGIHDPDRRRPLRIRRLRRAAGIFGRGGCRTLNLRSAIGALTGTRGRCRSAAPWQRTWVTVRPRRPRPVVEGGDARRRSLRGAGARAPAVVDGRVPLAVEDEENVHAVQGLGHDNRGSGMYVCSS